MTQPDRDLGLLDAAIDGIARLRVALHLLNHHEQYPSSTGDWGGGHLEYDTTIAGDIVEGVIEQLRASVDHDRADDADTRGGDVMAARRKPSTAQNSVAGRVLAKRDRLFAACLARLSPDNIRLLSDLATSLERAEQQQRKERR